MPQASSVTGYTCPNCAPELIRLRAKLNSAEAQNRQLKRAIREVHTFFSSWFGMGPNPHVADALDALSETLQKCPRL